MRSKGQKERIDLGLEIIDVVRKPGEVMTCAEIAAFCDCSPVAIRHIEKNAMRKLKQVLKRANVDKTELEAVAEC